MRLRRFVKFGVKHLMGAEVRGIGLNLTRRCNTWCQYCRIVNNSKEFYSRELSPEQWKRIIDRFIDNGCLHFIFTGGEPLVYGGVYELIEYASERAITSIITNTLKLNEERFYKLRHLDYMTFSFDTVHSESETFTKNPTERLGLIKRECDRHEIIPTAICTVTSQNTEEVEEMVRVLDAHGISAMLSIIHSDEGDWDFRNHTPELEFRSEEDFARLTRLQERLVGMKRDGLRVAESEGFINAMSDYARGTYQVDCPATDPFLTVDFDGRIKACHDTPASDVSALAFDDWDLMRAEVKKTVKEGCNCFYNCYVYGRNTKLDNLKRALAR